MRDKGIDLSIRQIAARISSQRGPILRSVFGANSSEPILETLPDIDSWSFALGHLDEAGENARSGTEDAVLFKAHFVQ